MGTRQELRASSPIYVMCVSQGFSPDDLYKKARLLLSCYRHICWTSYGARHLSRDGSYVVTDDDIFKALHYLETYSPDESKPVFEKNLKILFNPKCLIDLVGSAMIQVKAFPDSGDLYFNILSKFYLDRFKYCESDLLSLLCIERSRYYDRKKEAVLIFGLALWGSVIPNFTETIKNAPLSPAVINA